MQTIKCDNCNKELYENDNVYYENGLTYNACSLSCFAILRTNVTSTTVKNRLKEDF